MRTVRLTNVTDYDIEVEDAGGGRLMIPAHQTVRYASEIAGPELMERLEVGEIIVEDERMNHHPFA